MMQMSDEELWEEIEKREMPCEIRLLCSCKKTYTGAGTEYVALGSIVNEYVSLQLEEVRRDKENVLWGRLKRGEGWIDLKDIQLCE